MGQGPEKIDLSLFESWDLFQNNQHKLHFTCAELCGSVKPVKIFSNWLDYNFYLYSKMQSKLLGSLEFALMGYLVNIYAIQSILMSDIEIDFHFWGGS